MGIKSIILSLPFVKREIHNAVNQDRLYDFECEERRDQEIMDLRTGMPIIILTAETTPELGIITGWFNKHVPYAS